MPAAALDEHRWVVMTATKTPPDPHHKGPDPTNAPASCATKPAAVGTTHPAQRSTSDGAIAGTDGSHKLTESAPTGTQKQDAAANNAGANTPWLFWVNLLLLIAGGTWLCFWLLYYTDKFDDFGKILALGGGLTWLAFVLKLVSEERIKALQAAVDRWVFSNWLLTALLVVACCFGYWYSAHYGTLQVELFEGSEDRTVAVKIGDAVQEPARLAPGARIRILTWTSRKKPASLYVKVSGYPDLRVSISPYERKELRIPTSFIRRVILVKPTAALIVHRTDGLQVSVKLKSGTLYKTQFDGSPIWIGADEDVFVPQTMLARWRDSLADNVRSGAMSYLQHPHAITTLGFDLSSGDRVCVELQRKSGSIYSRKDITVRALEPNQEFPQEEEIDVRSDENSTDPPSC